MTNTHHATGQFISPWARYVESHPAQPAPRTSAGRPAPVIYGYQVSTPPVAQAAPVRSAPPVPAEASSDRHRRQLVFVLLAVVLAVAGVLLVTLGSDLSAQPVGGTATLDVSTLPAEPTLRPYPG